MQVISHFCQVTPFTVIAESLMLSCLGPSITVSMSMILLSYLVFVSFLHQDFSRSGLIVLEVSLSVTVVSLTSCVCLLTHNR